METVTKPVLKLVSYKLHLCLMTAILLNLIFRFCCILESAHTTAHPTLSIMWNTVKGNVSNDFTWESFWTVLWKKKWGWQEKGGPLNNDFQVHLSKHELKHEPWLTHLRKSQTWNREFIQRTLGSFSFSNIIKARRDQEGMVWLWVNTKALCINLHSQ